MERPSIEPSSLAAFVIALEVVLELAVDVPPPALPPVEPPPPADPPPVVVPPPAALPPPLVETPSVNELLVEVVLVVAVDELIVGEEAIVAVLLAPPRTSEEVAALPPAVLVVAVLEVDRPASTLHWPGPPARRCSPPPNGSSRRLRRRRGGIYFDNDIGEFLRIGQPAKRIDRQLKYLPRGRRLLADLSGRGVEILVPHGRGHIQGRHVPRGQFLRIEPNANAIIALPLIGNIGNTRHAEQFIANIDRGVIAQVDFVITIVGRE